MLTEKVALVSGSATGIGRDSAVKLAQDGFSLVLCDWNREEGEATLDMCRKQGADADFVYTDMGNEEEVVKYFAFAVEKYGKIDFYFNNQGVIYDPKDLDDTTVEDFEKVDHSNFKACFLGIKHCLKQMKEQKYGNILVTGSSSGIRPETGFGVYSATKHAVIGLVKDAAMEYGKYNIRVNVVCPGGIVTPITMGVGKYVQESGYQLPRAAQMAIMGKSGYLGTTEEIVGIVSMMASEASSYMTGAVISVDGGITL